MVVLCRYIWVHAILIRLHHFTIKIFNEFVINNNIPLHIKTVERENSEK